MPRPHEPSPTSNRNRPTLIFLRTAAITAATAIAVGGVLVITGGDEDTPAARERSTSPRWPGGDSSLEVDSSTAPSTTTGPAATPTTPSASTSAAAPAGGDTPAPNNGPAPAPTTAPPTTQSPAPPDTGPPVPGAPCDNPGEFGQTASGEPVMCIADPGTSQPTWHLGPE